MEATNKAQWYGSGVAYIIKLDVHIRWYSIRLTVTGQMPLAEQEMPTFPENLSSSPFL